MAKNRIVNTKFWTDTYVLDKLNPVDKLLFLYLITNPYTDISGVYELPLKVMAVETGIDRENIENVILPRFEKDGKIIYRNGWVAIKNFQKHQTLNSKVISGMKLGLDKAPSELRVFIENDSLSGSMDSLSGSMDSLSGSMDSLSGSMDSLSHPNPNPNPNPNSNSNTNSPIGDDFNRFWEIYPRKIGKKMARLKWIKLSLDIRKIILDDIKNRRNSVEWQDIKYVPHPTTYLNGERWNDVITIKQTKDDFSNF